MYERYLSGTFLVLCSTMTDLITAPKETRAQRPIASPQLVLLFDGLCGFCDKTVQHIFKHDKRGTMMFAPLQSDFAKQVMARHPRFQKIDSMIVIERHGETETAYAYSAAALRIASYLGGIHSLANVTRVVPPKIRDVFYRLFARYRYRLFGKHESCPLPTKEQRARYIAMP
jgi:predicted DCC family thiol-disulfide oxidoreductase YuxK